MYEQKELDNKPAEFTKEQRDFNSAELYNQELRQKYQYISCFELRMLPEQYQTRKFKLYKIKQIIRIAEYLQKVLKLILSIDKQITKCEKKAESILSGFKYLSVLEKDIAYLTLLIPELLDLLSDIKVSITELETDKSSINISDFVSEIWETLRLSLAICYIPDDMASKIDSLYPNISLKKLSSLNDTSKNRKEFFSHLQNLKNRLYLVFNLFITNLINQFSYYVTSPAFLNNPKGLTIFVIPMSMYIMFDFCNSGLTRSEMRKSDQKELFSINPKYIKFYKTVDGYLKSFLEEAKDVQEKVKEEEEFFNIQNLIDYYIKTVPSARVNQIEEFVSNPIVFEKISIMTDKIKQSMIVSMSKKENPWDTINNVHESKDIDNSTIYFLLQLYEMHPGKLLKFPQAQLKDFLNLCSYSKRPPASCMNEHVRRYKEGVYRLYDSYKNLFLPILMN